MLSLRPYQSTIIEQIRGHLRAGRSRILCVSPTGSGKTSLTAHMIANAIAKEKRAWFCVHRVELVRQSIETLEGSAGIHVGVIASGFNSNGYHPAAQVCSIQSLMRRWERYALPDLLVIDEAHHLVSKSWTTLIAAIVAKKPNIKIIGLTATPQRLDGRGLGQWFEVMVQGPSTTSLIKDGYLSPYKLFAPSTVNLSTVHTVAGDYNKAELDDAMRGSRVVGDAIAEYRTKCAGKRALMFLWSVRASEQMSEQLNSAGIPATHIDGTTNDVERLHAVRNFRNGRIKVLCNVDIVSEGFDLPAIEALFLLSPTQSLGRYLQMVGRSLRPFPGKDYALIMDHSGLAFQHGLPDDEHVWSLEGSDKKTKGLQKSPIRQCLKCFAVVRAGTRVCPECGFVFQVKEREIQQEEGSLVELDHAAMERLFAAKARRVEQGTAQTLEQLREFAQRKGYRPGWADHVHAAREAKKQRSELSITADKYRP